MTTTSHDIDVTSRNQPHYLISRHFTTNHIVSFNPATNHIKTGHHIAAMERLKARSHKKLGLGIALVGRLCAHSMGQNIRPACPALLAYTEWNTCIMCIEYAGFLWALCPLLSCTAEDSRSFYSPGMQTGTSMQVRTNLVMHSRILGLCRRRAVQWHHEQNIPRTTHRFWQLWLSSNHRIPQGLFQTDTINLKNSEFGSKGTNACPVSNSCSSGLSKPIIRADMS